MRVDELESDVINAPIMVEETMESGQFFNWVETDGWYRTVVDGEEIAVRDSSQGESESESESEGVEYIGSRDTVTDFLGLGDSVEEIKQRIDHDERVRKAMDRYPGLRLVNSDFYTTTISFIISAQNRIPRIRSLVVELSERYGDLHDGAPRFPEPETLAGVSESELRDVGLGYRAPYVKESSRQIDEGEVSPREIREMEYHDAHREIQELMGVGDKVGDCILLFGLDFHEAVPLDTWMEKTIDEYYTSMSGDSYMETCDNFREKFGEWSGYAQNYLFHYIRHHG